MFLKMRINDDDDDDEKVVKYLRKWSIRKKIAVVHCNHTNNAIIVSLHTHIHTQTSIYHRTHTHRITIKLAARILEHGTEILFFFG